jgi:hypothetical protein
MDFADPLDAYRFIVSWNGTSVYDLKDAISTVRFEGTGSVQATLLDLMDDVCKKLSVNPQLADHLAHKPLWAVDRQGRALVGVPGHERVIDLQDPADFLNT